LNIVIGSQIDLFVFNGLPKTLDKNIAHQDLLPSILKAILCFKSRFVKAILVK